MTFCVIINRCNEIDKCAIDSAGDHVDTDGLPKADDLELSIEDIYSFRLEEGYNLYVKNKFVCCNSIILKLFLLISSQILSSKEPARKFHCF